MSGAWTGAIPQSALSGSPTKRYRVKPLEGGDMGTIHKTYTRSIYKQLRYRPTWLPGTPVELGTVGVLKDGIFRAVTDLHRLGLTYTAKMDPASDGALDYTSEKGVSIAFKAAGQLNTQFKALGEAEAGALVEFSEEDAIVMQNRGVTLNRIEDQPALMADMLRLLAVADDSKRWNRDWVVISEVAQVESATIVISVSGSSRIELKASGAVAPTSLADASANLTVASESQVSTKIIAESGLTPLYRGLRVKRDFWWLYDEVLPADASAPAAVDVFADADPEYDILDAPD
jgi:hypothetical protein